MADKVNGLKSSTLMEDGRWRHSFSQSWLNDLELCDERGRLDLVGELPRIESDAASLGTAVHAGAEFVLRDWKEYDSPGSLDDAKQVAQLTLTEMIAMPNWQWKKYDEASMRALADTHVTNWYQQVLPKLSPPDEIEWSFKRTFHEDDKRQVVFTGTADLVVDPELWDWKTSGRPYNIKDKQKAAIQPTIYSWARAAETGAAPPWRFNYVVMIHPSSKTGKGATAQVQELSVLRHAGHVEWLRKRVLAVAEMIEAGLPHWPMKDDGWHCSTKWCPAYARCKGEHVGD